MASAVAPVTAASAEGRVLEQTDQKGASMTERRVAIACQGGGSQCAFVAGALKALLTPEARKRYRLVGLSGTSGGAITAALAWFGLLKQAQGDATPVEDRVGAFWKDLSAQTPQEIVVDGFCVQMMRLFEGGYLPGFMTSPASPQFRLWSRLIAQMVGRPEFTDLRALLLKHLDFEALPSLVRRDSPILLVGAADVLEGTFKTFSSVRGEIGVDALLASAAVPTLFPAVWVESHAYWDGIFSSNPPVTAFLRKAFMGDAPLPDEIWIVRINPLGAALVPERPSDIVDRRNQMAGNLSLEHELKIIEITNLLIEERALTDEFRARIGMDAANKITVRAISMSEAVLERMDYPSKLSRNPHHISDLMADGEAQAFGFLSALEQAPAH